MAKEKSAKAYAKLYADVLAKNYGKDREKAYSKFYDKYMELVTSEDYEQFDREHGKNVPLLKIYVGLAVYFVSTDFGYSFEECENIYYAMAKPIWDKSSKLVNFIEGLPHGFWLFTHLLDKLEKGYEPSVVHSKSEFSKDKYEYVITKCAYIDIFEHYGIRKFCKVFCDSDIGVMGGMCKHAKYVRYHDMTEADTCHNAVVRVKQ